MTDAQLGTMLTVDMVADRMGVSERTVFRWIEAGNLKAFRMGRVLRISEAELIDFIDERTCI